MLSPAARLGFAKIALAQLLSFIFSKMNEAGFITGNSVATQREQENVTFERASGMREMIMKHQRAPGDAEIESKGCVIATYTPELIAEDLRDKNQLIRCSAQGRDRGVSFFNPPESCPSWLKEAVEHYSDTVNGTLSLILVSPEAQGTGVFKMLMNATMCSLAATGATHIVGWVEHTNQRAIAAYERLGGSISSECAHQSRAPNGETTTFKAFRIPIRGLQRVALDEGDGRC